MLAISEILLNIEQVPRIIISIACMLFGGFLMSRLTKFLKLPNVIAYIVAGILLGPFCFNIIPESVISGMDFMSDIAVAFIAFGSGEFFKIKALKKNGMKVIIIAIIETLISAILVFILTYFILKLGLVLSLIISSLSMASAPTSIMMNIRQCKAKGDFVDNLLLVVAIDDIIGLITFSVILSICSSTSLETTNLKNIILPLLYNIFVILLGGCFGLLLKLLMPIKRSNDNKLIIGIALLFTFCGICEILDISPLLGCMSMGMVYINISEDEKFFRQISYFSPPFLLLFFVKSGLNLKLDAMFSNSSYSTLPLFVVGLLIFIFRDVGKYSGTYLGSILTKKEKNIRNNLGLALFSQASVSIGLASIAAREFAGSNIANVLETIIIISSIFNEFIGPILSKSALYLSKSCTNDINEVSNIKDENEYQNKVDLLIAQINDIQNSLEKHDEKTDEDIFVEASNELYNYNNQRNHFRFRR